MAVGLDPEEECMDSLCGAVTCDGAGACGAAIACDAGDFDAGPPRPDASVDPTIDASVDVDGGVETGVPDATLGSPDAFVPEGVDAAIPGGTVARVPLSCTCSAVGTNRSRSDGAALLGLTTLALALAVRRRRVRARGALGAIGLSIALLVSLGAHASHAHAQATTPTPDEAEAQREARARFELGHAHYDAGRYVEAAAEFERAYALTHRPGLLYNLHLSYQFAGNMPEATRTLRLYLENATDIEATVRRALERRLATAEAALASHTPIAPTEPNEPVEPTEPEQTDPIADQPDVVVTPPSGGGDHVDDTASSGLGLEPGLAVLGVGAALVIGAAVTGGLALGAQSERDAACTAGVTMVLCPSSYDQQSVVGRFTTMRDTAWALGIVGGIAVAAGAVLVILGATDDAPAVTPQAACGPDGCVAGVAGRF
jgi:MYXO-CTERM domain-containing protein